MLRMQQYHLRAPAANEGSAALHLTNFALHGVVRRLHKSNDPRMAALDEVRAASLLMQMLSHQL